MINPRQKLQRVLIGVIVLGMIGVIYWQQRPSADVTTGSVERETAATSLEEAIQERPFMIAACAPEDIKNPEANCEPFIEADGLTYDGEVLNPSITDLPEFFSPWKDQFSLYTYVYDESYTCLQGYYEWFVDPNSAVISVSGCEFDDSDPDKYRMTVRIAPTGSDFSSVLYKSGFTFNQSEKVGDFGSAVATFEMRKNDDFARENKIWRLISTQGTFKADIGYNFVGQVDHSSELKKFAGLTLTDVTGTWFTNLKGKAILRYIWSWDFTGSELTLLPGSKRVPTLTTLEFCPDTCEIVAEDIVNSFSGKFISNDLVVGSLDNLNYVRRDIHTGTGFGDTKTGKVYWNDDKKTNTHESRSYTLSFSDDLVYKEDYASTLIKEPFKNHETTDYRYDREAYFPATFSPDSTSGDNCRDEIIPAHTLPGKSHPDDDKKGRQYTNLEGYPDHNGNPYGKNQWGIFNDGVLATTSIIVFVPEPEVHVEESVKRICAVTIGLPARTDYTKGEYGITSDVTNGQGSGGHEGGKITRLGNSVTPFERILSPIQGGKESDIDQVVREVFSNKLSDSSNYLKVVENINKAIKYDITDPRVMASPLYQILPNKISVLHYVNDDTVSELFDKTIARLDQELADLGGVRITSVKWARTKEQFLAAIADQNFLPDGSWLILGGHGGANGPWNSLPGGGTVPLNGIRDALGDRHVSTLFTSTCNSARWSSLADQFVGSVGLGLATDNLTEFSGVATLGGNSFTHTYGDIASYITSLMKKGGCSILDRPEPAPEDEPSTSNNDTAVGDVEPASNEPTESTEPTEPAAPADEPADETPTSTETPSILNDLVNPDPIEVEVYQEPATDPVVTPVAYTPPVIERVVTAVAQAIAYVRNDPTPPQSSDSVTQTSPETTDAQAIIQNIVEPVRDPADIKTLTWIDKVAIAQNTLGDANHQINLAKATQPVDKKLVRQLTYQARAAQRNYTLTQRKLKLVQSLSVRYKAAVVRVDTTAAYLAQTQDTLNQTNTRRNKSLLRTASARHRTAIRNLLYVQRLLNRY